MDSKARPKFSILIPTRNRHRFIRTAIESALSQTVTDLELVISDNNDDDKTRDIVQSFSDPRIVYTRPDRTLGMPDNWQNSLRHSRGEWIILLEDDCVLSARCLELITQALQRRPVELVTWCWESYYSQDYTDETRRIQYVHHTYKNSIETLVAADELREVFSLRFRPAHPRPYNACASRALIERIEQRLGRSYLAPAPDYTFMPAAMALIDKFVFIDVPLMLSNSGGTTPHSSETHFSTFLGELGEDKRGGYTPLELPVARPWNIVAESICRVQREMPELAGYSLQIEPYLVDFMGQLLEFKDEGFAVDFERARFYEFISKLGAGEKLRVFVGIAKRRAKWVTSRKVKAQLFRYPALARSVGRLTSRNVIRGADVGFSDIGGAMRHLQQSHASLQLAD
jgi:glycosyltransferase involved in cell wall biosynthesis